MKAWLEEEQLARFKNITDGLKQEAGLQRYQKEDRKGLARRWFRE